MDFYESLFHHFLWFYYPPIFNEYFPFLYINLTTAYQPLTRYGINQV